MEIQRRHLERQVRSLLQKKFPDMEQRRQSKLKMIFERDFLMKKLRMMLEVRIKMNHMMMRRNYLKMSKHDISKKQFLAIIELENLTLFHLKISLKMLMMQKSKSND